MPESITKIATGVDTAVAVSVLPVGMVGVARATIVSVSGARRGRVAVGTARDGRSGLAVNIPRAAGSPKAWSRTAETRSTGSRAVVIPDPVSTGKSVAAGGRAADCDCPLIGVATGETPAEVLKATKGRVGTATKGVTIERIAGMGSAIAGTFGNSTGGRVSALSPATV